MIIVTTEYVHGKEITESLGMVRGNSTRARFFGRDIVAFFKNFTGGKVSEYSNLLSRTRQDAIEQMTQEAQKLDADAIVNVRFTTSNITQGISEILAFGTAVKLQ
ncbi:MAG: YbjQ family protein [Bacteroidales bacterium]